jgi:hypothetical protein
MYPPGMKDLFDMSPEQLALSMLVLAVLVGELPASIIAAGKPLPRKTKLQGRPASIESTIAGRRRFDNGLSDFDGCPL